MDLKVYTKFNILYVYSFFFLKILLLSQQHLNVKCQSHAGKARQGLYVHLGRVAFT